jgi:hypothetical protein
MAADLGVTAGAKYLYIAVIQLPTAKKRRRDLAHVAERY